MANEKHTPGPWKFDKAGQSTMLMTEDNKPLGFFYSDRRVGDETKANARLIAASPVMASRIQGALDCLSQNKVYPADIEQAKLLLRSALAHADIEAQPLDRFTKVGAAK